MKKILFFLSLTIIICYVSFELLKSKQNIIEIINSKIETNSSNKSLKVLFALDTECPLSTQYIKKINSLAEKYSDNFEFLIFFPGPYYSNEEVEKFIEKNNIKIKFLIDDDLMITKSLKASVVPESFLINIHSKIIYQGLIDNWVSELGRTRQYTNKNYLENAMKLSLKGVKPLIKKTKAIGCLIEKDFTKKTKSDSSVNAMEIIFEKCASCHYNGGAAPFPLTSYEDIDKRKKMIYHVISSNYMPPWPADPNYSNFLGEKTLTKKEKKIIHNWIKNKKKLEYSEKEKIIFKSNKEKPDLVVKMENEYKIKGNNKDKFLMMKFPFELPYDTFIKSIKFIPGNNQIVHHVNAHLISYNHKKKNIFNGDRIVDTELFSDSICFEKLDLFNDDRTVPNLSRSVSNYLPGSAQGSYPKGIGVIKAKRKNVILVNDFHYGPSNIDTTDNSYFEIYFSDTPPKRNLEEITLGTLGLKENYYSHDTTFYCTQKISPELIVKPNEKITCTTKAKIVKDISILTINPHMHLLGKSFKSYVITAEKDTIPLIKIDDWNFRWQYFYTFEKMIKIPKNSEIIIEATFDNTNENLDNPFDPPKLITEKIDWNGKGSMKTSDEMMQFIITYLPYKKNDEKISLKP